jgi:hypothetical protein
MSDLVERASRYIAIGGTNGLVPQLLDALTSAHAQLEHMRADTIEECAKVAELTGKTWEGRDLLEHRFCAYVIAAAIRALAEKDTP